MQAHMSKERRRGGGGGGEGKGKRGIQYMNVCGMGYMHTVCEEVEG